MIYVAALDDESDEYNILLTLLSQERNKKHFALWNLFVIVHIWNGNSRRGHSGIDYLTMLTHEVVFPFLWALHDVAKEEINELIRA